jgi:hypothetical protein
VRIVSSGFPRNSLVWQVSWGGTGDWNTLRTIGLPFAAAAVGPFDGSQGDDVLAWHDNYLDILSGGSADPVRQSNQDIRRGRLPPAHFSAI